MTMRGAAEVLYETETTLRLVGNVLDDLQVIGIDLGKPEVEYEDSSDDRDEPKVADLAPIRVYREVQEGLRALQRGRGILERTSEEKGRSSGLDDEHPPVSATDALSGLDRAVALLDRLQSDTPADAGQADVFDLLRQEIRAANASLRVYAITEQQLSYASSVLLDMEGRMTELTHMLDPCGFEALGAGLISDRSQSTLRMSQRQSPS